MFLSFLFIDFLIVIILVSGAVLGDVQDIDAVERVHQQVVLWIMSAARCFPER